MTDLTFQADDFVVPPGTLKAWQGEQALAFRSAIAAEFDNLAIAAELTAKARSPLLCDASVLPYHARDRRIRRYTTETDVSWRMRLAKWKQIHQSGGRAWGLLRQLRIMLLPYGRPLLRYVSTSGDGAQSQWFTLQPGDSTRDYFQIGGLDPEFSRTLTTPGNWIWDANATAGYYSRYWILIYTSGLTNPIQPIDWDGVDEWDGGGYWDGYLQSDVLADCAQLCIDWGAAQSRLTGLFLVHDDTTFDPTGSGAGYPNGTWNLWANRRTGVTYSIVR